MLFLTNAALADLAKSYENVGFDYTSGSDCTYTIGDTVGVTQGTYSLGITGPAAGTWWDWAGTDWNAPDSGGPSLASLVASHSTVLLDVTVDHDAAPSWDDYIQLQPQIVGDGVNSSLPWSANVAGGTSTTLTWDYSAVNFTNPTPGWMQLQWHLVAPDMAHTLHIDNLRFEGPPPSSIPDPRRLCCWRWPD